MDVGRRARFLSQTDAQDQQQAAQPSQGISHDHSNEKLVPPRKLAPIRAAMQRRPLRRPDHTIELIEYKAPHDRTASRSVAFAQPAARVRDHAPRK
jgi:hypothetical protein